MNKTSNPDRYLRSFYESVALANRFQLPVTYSIMLNYPGETWQSYVILTLGWDAFVRIFKAAAYLAGCLLNSVRPVGRD
jgi:hypothetical protein